MSRALRLALLVAPALVLAGCEDPAPPSTAVAVPSISIPAGQTACSLLLGDQVQPALQPVAVPAASGAPAASVAPVAVIIPTATVKTVTTTIGGGPQPVQTSQCTYTSPSAASVVVTVLPAQKAGTVQFAGTVAELSDYTDGATTVMVGGSPVSVQQSTQAVIGTFQGGNVVISIAYLGTEPAGPPSRVQRVANLVAAVLRTAPPSLPAAGGPVALNSPQATSTPRPAAGEKATGATAAVKVQETDDLKFVADSVTVKVGDVVEWDNSGTVPHNVTFSGQPAITSSTMSGGDKFQVKFTTAGTYSYICTFHKPGMIGSVTVTG